MLPNFNRLTRTYLGVWKQFQGLYLVTGDGDDVYLHSQQNERMAALVGMLSGFAVLGGQAEPATNLQVDITKRTLAFGFYRWPTAWRITWQGAKGRATMTLTLSDRKRIANWVIGGFSMGLVRGELKYDQRTWPVYGPAELIIYMKCWRLGIFLTMARTPAWATEDLGRYPRSAPVRHAPERGEAGPLLFSFRYVSP